MMKDRLNMDFRRESYFGGWIVFGALWNRIVIVAIQVDILSTRITLEQGRIIIAAATTSSSSSSKSRRRLTGAFLF